MTSVKEFKEPYQAYLDAILNEIEETGRDAEALSVDVQPMISLRDAEVLPLELMPVQDDTRSYTAFNRRANAIISTEERRMKYIPFTVE